MTPASLICRNINLDRGAEPVLRDISFNIGPGTCLGVVGPNGVGKSTLLKVLAGDVDQDSGTVVLAPPGAGRLYVEQEHKHGGHGGHGGSDEEDQSEIKGLPSRKETVRKALVRMSGLAAAEAEFESAALALGSGSWPGSGSGSAGVGESSQNPDERYAIALERLSAFGMDADLSIDEVLKAAGLGSLADRDTSVLSGGEAAKLALCAVELSAADVLLLDEPTNDLDFAGLARLEDLIAAGRQAVTVVVSHDRAFLERTVTAVFELDEHDHTGRYYDGGWASYEEERSTARRHAAEAFDVYQSRKKGLDARARREREWSTTGVKKEQRNPRDNDKAQRGFRVNKTEKLASRARRTERQSERLEAVEKPWEGWQLQFEINETQRAGDVVARLSDAVIVRGDFKLGPIDLEISWGDRLAILGPNGSGKSTIVGALLGRIPLERGSRHLGPGVVVGELGQERHSLSAGSTLLEAVCARCEMTTTEARTLLAKFGLVTDHVTRPGASLSPGERTRAELATFQARGVNLLVLDEPTNHLDLPAIEQLEQALESFGGTIILVSHDRRLLENVRLSERYELP
ncbi:MAG: ABC-F family ATP-binding cassette domain-containing protein [Acidimicrobiales bacterium]